MITLFASLLITSPLVSRVDSLSLSRNKTMVGLSAIAFAPAPSGTRMLVTSEDGTVRLFDCAAGATIKAMTKHLQSSYGAAWSPDGNKIATGDETARVFIEGAAGGMIKQYRTHFKGVQKLSFNSEGNLLLSTGKDDSIRIYSTSGSSAKENRLILGNGSNPYGGVFMPGSPSMFVVGVLGKGARVYDASTGAMKAELNGHGGQGVLDVAINNTSTVIATVGKDGNAILWNAKTFQPITTFRAHADWATNATFSPNGKYLATSGVDRLVRVWNVETHQKVAEIGNCYGVGSPIAFTANGASLVSANDSGYLQIHTVSPAQPGSQIGAAKPGKKLKKAKTKKRKG